MEKHDLHLQEGSRQDLGVRTSSNGEEARVPWDSGLVFDNLVWLSSQEAARYLRKSVGALRTMVSRGHLRARKFRRRLYFRRIELDRLLESSEQKGGL